MSDRERAFAGRLSRHALPRENKRFFPRLVPRDGIFFVFLKFIYFYFLLNRKEEMKNWTQKLHNLKESRENNNILSFQPFVVRRIEEPEHRSCNFRVRVSFFQ